MGKRFYTTHDCHTECYGSEKSRKLIRTLLAACKLAMGAFEHNHCIDWGEIEAAIKEAE